MEVSGHNSYSALATLRSLRVIFEENQDKTFEARWALAKESKSYRGFQIVCNTTARILLITIVPLVVLIAIVFQESPPGLRVGSHHVNDYYVAASALVYVALSIVVSARLGKAIALKRIARTAVPNQRSG